MLQSSITYPQLGKNLKPTNEDFMGKKYKWVLEKRAERSRKEVCVGGGQTFLIKILEYKRDCVYTVPA